MSIQSFTIDKNVPVPSRGAKSKYPFGAMEVGDSFFIAKQRADVASAACSYGKKHNKKYAVYVEENGCRCWRTA